MLEGLVVWVLNNYLGKYVENLNTDQLSVALLSGKVELENLPLRKDALRHLGLPVEVKSGFIGKVQLQVPVRQIRSAPWLIAIEKLYVVAAPVNLDEWDGAAEANIAHERKVALLDAMEAQWRADHEVEDVSYYATSYSSWLSYGTGLLTNIIENLQLKVNDVHIRYEDAVTCGSRRAFACGLTVDSLTAESCDPPADDGRSLKLLELQRLAVYWDPVRVPGGLLAGCARPELAERMAEGGRVHVLAPSTAEARVRRDRCEQPLRSRTRPRVHVALTLHRVDLSLTDRQYWCAVECARGLQRIARVREYRARRPQAPLRSDARAWWIYALKCHMPHHTWMEPRPTWQSCGERARQVRQYVEVCLGLLSNPAAALPPDRKALKDDVEWHTPLPLLRALREIAMRKVPAATPAATPATTPDSASEASRSMLVHWFPQWWGWYAAPPSANSAPTDPAPPSRPQLEEEILDVIADSLEMNSLQRRDTLFAHFEFLLSNGCMNLCVADPEKEEESSPCLELQFSGVRVDVSSRLSVSVGDVWLRDRLTPRTLFPLLVAPQGMIREGLSAMNVTSTVMTWCRQQSATPTALHTAEPLFHLTLEPLGQNDYNNVWLYVKSQSLEVVYNAGVVAWVSEFVGRPWRAHPAPQPEPRPEPLELPRDLYASVRDSTRMRLINHWEHILQGQLGKRSSLKVELDISAPQILLVEDFTDRDASVMLVDFGKMHLTNRPLSQDDQHTLTDDEEFMTPWSTPPGSPPTPPAPAAAPPPAPSVPSPALPAPPLLDQAALYRHIYDTYRVQLSDLQVLVGRARDNWKYAHTKTTSSLHVLDRFSISLQAERRVVRTRDPLYPSAALCGSLPALVVHLSEHKLAAARRVLACLAPSRPAHTAHTAHTAPHSTGEEETAAADTPAAGEEETRSDSSDTERTERAARLASTLLMLQFSIDQMLLEVQARGRSIAEVQVCGVRAGASRRPRDYSLSLSVHSLLLVDALQTAGPDFELLVASHKHVGMDVASGSIRGSEPTSPTSPTSPASPAAPPPPPQPTPLALAAALYPLVHRRRCSEVDRSSPAPPGTAWSGGWGGAEGTGGWGSAGIVDSEALIAVELCVVHADGDNKEDLRIANILFNNLDIIANQETIVELIGFTRRVFGGESAGAGAALEASTGAAGAVAGAGGALVGAEHVRTEVTFDFHRLGVLLLRAARHEGRLIANKIATATLSELNVQATIASERVSVSGSLGGLQVVSLCARAGLHRRLVSVGRPVPPGPPAPAGPLAPPEPPPRRDDAALTFTVHRDHRDHCDNHVLESESVGVSVRVSVHVASVWYTHSAAVLAELQCCVAEFEQYLANLARSIRAAAADMAIGLVLPQHRMETEGVSPRRMRTTSLGASLDNDALADCLKSERIVLSVSVELETPVVVVPRAAHSGHVFVAHLGRMTLTNRPGPPADRCYYLRLRDISLYTLDASDRLDAALGVDAGADVRGVYSCTERGKPVLHDTALHLHVEYSDRDPDTTLCEITGKIVGELRVTSTREQYEQLLETVQSLGAGVGEAGVEEAVGGAGREAAEGADQEVGGAVALRLDPHLGALPAPQPEPARPSHAAVKVNFNLPMFTVELRGDFGSGEKSLVDLSFKDFNVNYEKIQPYETMVQVSLHSVTMEDLTQDVESKHRMLMVSHTPQVPKAVFVSKSCPDFVSEFPAEERLSDGWSRRSLPAALQQLDAQPHTPLTRCGATPPSSPRSPVATHVAVDDELSSDDNLVWISVHMRDPQHPHFEDKYNKVSKFTKVDFNCLNLVVSIDSWVAVLDFFGVAGDDAAEDADPPPPAAPTPHADGGGASVHTGVAAGLSEVEVWVRSLSVVLVGSGRGELCRAHVSRLAVSGGAHSPGGLRGRLGALALADLTPHAALWRDRFLAAAAGTDALAFHYRRYPAAEAARDGYTSALHIESAGVRYVHTKRFVAEMQAFFREFSLLRRVLREARRKVSAGGAGRARRARLSLRCRAPTIAVPVSARSRRALELRLESLTSDNRFVGGDGGGPLLDVRSVRVERASLWCAIIASSASSATLTRLGPSLLRDVCTLTLQIEHNMEDTHDVADMTLQGGLESLECSVDPSQYAVLRGVLAHNLAEDISDLAPPTPPPTAPAPLNVTSRVWTLTSIKLDLQNVTVKLELNHGVSSLACINFIKSRLLVETYSDLSQDIDLVSQEILVSDTRYQWEPANRRGNVFSHILQPMHEHRHAVQAEVHARRRAGSAAYTVLINSMRLMAILDWWEQANQFLARPPTPSGGADEEESVDRGERPGTSAGLAPSAPATADHLELKLNITESQLVFVEDASVWDTNAVILKSTTVLSYRGSERKPVTCSLNNVEVFSCVLGLEDETALSIVSPAALHVELDADRVLHFQTSTLNLRLSYHDMRMFASMLQSLPAQARLALSGGGVGNGVRGARGEREAPANSVHMSASARSLVAMGFNSGDCVTALKACSGSVNEAALWLTMHAQPAVVPTAEAAGGALWPLSAVELRADCVTLCLIDDCLDSDVPLLEVALSDLHLEQDLRKVEEAFEDPVLVSTPMGAGGALVEAAAGAGARCGPAGGRLGGTLSADYYNRTLSGWEPVVEPWKFMANWEYQLSSQLHLRRLQVEVQSTDMLNSNVTAALVQLLQLVRNNWTQDYYAPQGGAADASPKSSPGGHRRRSPFVPYALRNHTGHKIWFTTFVTMSDMLTEQLEAGSLGVDDAWCAVRAGDTEPFSFGGRPRDPRHRHRLRLHQLALCVDGWRPVGPVCVDRVGHYYRLATHAKSGAQARIVLEVSLEGSARKLVTVRSALQLRNKLPHAVEVRVDHAPATTQDVSVVCGALRRRALGLPAPPRIDTYSLHPLPSIRPRESAQWGVSSSRTAQVASGATWAVPLSGAAAPLWVRPVSGSGAGYLYCSRPLQYRAATDDRPLVVHAQCASSADLVYRFCCVVLRDRYPPEQPASLAGHTLTLRPALRLQSLLPLELQCRVLDQRQRPLATATLAPGDTEPFHQVNVEEGIEISVKLEGFGWSTPLCVLPTATTSFSARIKLVEQRGRRLYLNTRTHIKRNDGLKVSVSAAYWVVNRSGLPLVFRAEGAAGEAAGQGAEHEVARVVQPLPFSFADAEAGPTLQARLGKGVHQAPEWCSPFGLGPGTAVRRLEVRGGGEGAGVGAVYAVGVSVRAGRGRYRHTNIVTLCPRYQIHNNTSYTLHLAQKCTATTLNDPGALATHLSAVAGCYLPWHWPRWDREHLLCVRVLGEGERSPGAWSGAFRLDAGRSVHVACRGGGGQCRYLRAEVVSQAATLFVVVTDAESAPPPLRLLNYSPVAVMFRQVGCAEESVAGARAALSWALPEPEAAPALSLRAPGGPRLTLHLDRLPLLRHLRYQNFLYVAFVATAVRNNLTDELTASTATEDDVLVLEVPMGTTKVILGKKRYGDRSQLWRRGPNEQLVHEGSSPPQPTDVLDAEDTPLSAHAMVLDMEGPAPHPGALSALCLRRADPRRVSTQSWRRSPAGRMCCAHANLCLQPDGGLFGLRQGNRVMLGLPDASGGRSSAGGVPPEQLVAWQRLRPGSGHLRVTVSADGPTRVVTIQDHEVKAESLVSAGWSTGGAGWEEEAGGGGSGGGEGGGEWGLRVRLRGVGVSLVAGEELAYAVLADLSLHVSRTPAQTAFTLSVRDMQWDNQLLGTGSPVLLYCLPERAGAGAGGGALPALHVDAEVTHSARRRYNAVFFRHAVVSLRPLAVRLEERLLLKLCRWAALPDDARATEQPDEADYETHRMLRELTAVHARRYYFGVIKIIPNHIRLSMCTASKLEPELAALKRRLGLTLIKFEDAAVELEPFSRAHHYETAGYLAALVLKHFKDQLKWQAAKILGSVDFLGNPLGFVSDVSEGVSGLIYEGSVGALIQNLTHGLSNSAAKVTESLGDGLERVVVDEAHEETRRRIRSEGGAGGAGGEQAHLRAGVRGFGLGLLGGVTSLVKHSYEGAAAEGLPGFLAGVGKGLVGTVTKPVIGVLDLAAETASYVRDTARRADRSVPARVRGPRCVAGLLARYSQRQSAGAQHLYHINRHDYTEGFLAYTIVRDRPHDIRALFSTRYLRIFTCKSGAPHLVMETHLSNLVSCVAMTSAEGGEHYVELGVRGEGGGGVRRPRVQCDTRALADWVARHAACAKHLYHDTLHTVLPNPYDTC